jgi:hypothetical protein
MISFAWNRKYGAVHRKYVRAKGNSGGAGPDPIPAPCGSLPLRGKCFPAFRVPESTRKGLHEALRDPLQPPGRPVRAAREDQHSGDLMNSFCGGIRPWPLGNGAASGVDRGPEKSYMERELFSPHVERIPGETPGALLTLTGPVPPTCRRRKDKSKFNH